MSGQGIYRENSEIAIFNANESNNSQQDMESSRTLENNEAENDSNGRSRNLGINIAASESPVVRKELQEIIENFGKSHSEPAFKRIVRTELSDTSLVYEHLTYTESRMVENINSAETEKAVLKESTEETTLDGKIIEIEEESHICHEDCPCGAYTQSLSDIEPLPRNYAVDDPEEQYEHHNQYKAKRDEMYHKISSTSPPLNIEKVKRHLEKVKEKKLAGAKVEEPCGCTHKADADQSYTETSAHVCSYEKNDEQGYTNRYNYNHVQIVRGKDTAHTPFRKLCEKVFGTKKKYKQKNMQNYLNEESKFENASGETIPQLYKAKLRQLSGTVPERFTFKAYTGVPPFENQEIKKGNFQVRGCYCHHIPPQEAKIGKSINFNEKKRKSSDIKKSNKKKKIVTKEYKEFPAPRACLNFEGNEYISTRGLPERIDIYCFDHLNTSYFRTSDQPPPLITDVAMERTETLATRFWAEIFGFLHIFLAFMIAFILQLYKFLLYSLVRPIMIGLVQLTSDYFFKPLLTIVYNGFTQPLLVFIFNVATSFRDVCSPIARGIGYFFSEIAVVLKAIRIIDLSKPPPQPTMKDSYC